MKRTDELSQLHQLSVAAKRGGVSSLSLPKSKAGPVPIQRTAAHSHKANDKYMDEFDAAHAELYGTSSTHTTTRMPTSFKLPASISSGNLIPYHPPISPRWSIGPLNPAGKLADLSDRPILCLAIGVSSSSQTFKASSSKFNEGSFSWEALCGGSDHAIYGVDVRRCEKTKTLHGGKFGHCEWVTSVCYLGDGSGRAVSSGMDGKICVWSARPTGRLFSCVDLIGHFGSVSVVASPGGGTASCGPASEKFGSCIVSAGYDKCVKLWNSSGALLFDKKAHGAPILNLSLLANDVSGEFNAISGDRDGIACVWNLTDGAIMGSLKGHKGHLTASAWMRSDSASTTGGGDLVLTGAQDGHVRVWDIRASTSTIANIGCHASDGGSGAVGDLSVATVGSETLIVSAGADKRLCVLDPRKGFNVRTVFSEHQDFIYSLTTAGKYSFSGGGDGMVIAHDLSEGRPLWAVGAGTAAIRGIAIANGTHLFATGDDGKCISYEFES